MVQNIIGLLAHIRSKERRAREDKPHRPLRQPSPTQRPTACRHCVEPLLHRHGTLSKPIDDHRCSEVIVERYKCLSCARTFRHYPSGVTPKNQSQRTVVLAALMYVLGLSCSAASHLLGALGAEISKMSV